METEINMKDKRIKELEEVSMELFNLVHDSDLVNNKIRANELYNVIKSEKGNIFNQTNIMSNQAKSAILENIEQNLIEIMADYLDSESLQLDQAIAFIKDPIPRKESELHIRMAKAAFLEYQKTIVDAN